MAGGHHIRRKPATQKDDQQDDDDPRSFDGCRLQRDRGGRALAREESKVGVRSCRRDAMEGIKKAVKDGAPEDMGKRKEAELQNLVNKYVEHTDAVVATKEKEIMTV